MRNWIIILACIVGTALSLDVARAELLQSASTHSPRSGAAGGFASVYLGGSFSGLAAGQLTYGFAEDVQGEVRVGGGSPGLLIGIYGKYRFLAHKVLSMAFWGGMFHTGTFAADFALPISHSFGWFELYAAPYARVPLNGAYAAGLGITPGVGIVVAKHIKIYGEGTIGLSNLGNVLTLGARYFF